MLDKESYKFVLNDSKIPFKPKLEKLSDIEIFTCDLFIDLNEFFANEKTKTKARVFRIYGDVIQLSKNLKIPPLIAGGVILIVARRLEIEKECHISVDYKKSFRIVVFAMEMPSELKIISKDQTFTFKINYSNIGKCLTLHDEKDPEYKDIDTFDNVILKKEPFIKILRFSLLIATTLFYEESKIKTTQSILSWIIKLTKSQTEPYSELYLQALSIFTQLKILEERRESKISFIPLLSKEIYKERIKEFINFAISYENKYNNIIDRMRENNLKETELKALLKDCNDMTRMHVHLKGVEKARYDSSHKLRINEESELENKIHDVDEKSENFRNGIEEWKHQQEIDAQKKMIVAIFDLAIGVGKIVVQPGGIVSFIETIEKTSSSINDALNAADAIKGVIDIIDMKNNESVKKLKNVNDNIEKIKEINNDLKTNFKKADNLNNEVKKGQESIQSLDINTLATMLETEDRKGIHLKAKWKSIKNDMKKLLKYPIDKGINGANEYLNSLESLFIYIDAYIDAKIEETESFKEFSRIKLQVETFENKEKSLKDLISNYKSEQDYYNEIALSLFERLINTKYWMSTYMDNYLCATFYWSLSKSNVKLSVMKTTEQHIKDYNKICDELEATYSKFRGSAQLSKHIIRLDGEYIKKFKHDRFVTFEISLNHEKLLKTQHVRLHEIKIFLNKAGSESDEIFLHISNTGVFADKFEEKEYLFRSEPIRNKIFRYNVLDKKILTKALFDDDPTVYFVPTPFSQWTIRLDNTCEIDLSTLESIEIELEVKCYFIYY
ncbi:5725_t:CDS:2 [Scutellospora calospora]|uniref:5725_t:CDS:1 n=1 Tax=Scutellospora calospora TaxID=85575 RepID=A0ACA9K3R0_9GLOM|nr:5725_t:CDS:2 [Scutellospora calospora]